MRVRIDGMVVRLDDVEGLEKKKKHSIELVIDRITIWQAASPENSQIFMLFGVAVLIPLILGYTAWAYWVFRGKVKPESGYH